MTRTMIVIALLTSAACTSPEATEDATLGETNDEVRQKNIACRSPRLTREGYRGEGAFVGDDGQVYVRAMVCMQDDDNGEWAQCDAEEGGGDFNGGPKGDWYGFWDTGEPMRGPCRVQIPLAGAPPAPTNGAQCKTAAHGRVNADTCFQEPDWKWYRCDAGGVTNGAAGPNAAGCAVTLWYQP